MQIGDYVYGKVFWDGEYKPIAGFVNRVYTEKEMNEYSPRDEFDVIVASFKINNETTNPHVPIVLYAFCKKENLTIVSI